MLFLILIVLLLLIVVNGDIVFDAITTAWWHIGLRMQGKLNFNKRKRPYKRRTYYA